jgi:hypothetical protein
VSHDTLESLVLTQNLEENLRLRFRVSGNLFVHVGDEQGERNLKIRE